MPSKEGKSERIMQTPFEVVSIAINDMQVVAHRALNLCYTFSNRTLPTRVFEQKESIRGALRSSHK